jgi:hypothetical protein
MRTLLTFFGLLIPMLLSAQAPILRNPATTNQFMNVPSSGNVPLWNADAGKWSNAVPPTASAAGNSGAVQFNEGGVFAGTNRFLYDRTNEVLSLVGSSAGSVRLYDGDSSHGINLIGNATLSSNFNLTFPAAYSNGVLSIVSVNDSNFNLAVIPSGSVGSLTMTNADTNSFTISSSTLYSKAFLPHMPFWDDFNGPDARFGDFLLRKSPSGHNYRLHADAAGTNGLLMTGGKLTQTNLVTDASFFFSISNTWPTLPLVYTRFGMIFRFSGDLTNGYSNPVMLNTPNHVWFSGDQSLLHTLLLPDGSLSVQSNITLNLSTTNTGINWFNDWIYWDVQLGSNVIVSTINDKTSITYHTNLHNIWKWPVTQWELFRQGANNSVTCEIDAVWAGFAESSTRMLVAPNPLPVTFQNTVNIDQNVVYRPSSMFLRTTNRWFDGGASSLYTNIFVANSGGVSNLLGTNLLIGSETTLEFQVEPGVLVGFPGTSAAQWGGAIPTMATGLLWNIVKVTVPQSGTTNYRHSVEGYELAAGSNITLSTNHATRVISVASTGGSQTPWTSDIDGDLFGLFDASFINVAQTNISGNAYRGSLVVSNAFTAPTNTVQESGIALDGSGYATGTTGVFGPQRTRGEFSWLPFNSAGTVLGTFQWKMRTNGVAAPVTIMTLNAVNTAAPILNIGPAPNMYASSGKLRVDGGMLIQGDISPPSASVSHTLGTAVPWASVTSSNMTAIRGIFYPTNTFIPTAAQIGASGGYWVGNSNGNLVTVYTLDGTTTAMKILAP